MEYVTFNHQSQPALDVLEREWGFDREAVRALRHGEFIARTDGGAEMRGRVF